MIAFSCFVVLKPLHFILLDRIKINASEHRLAISVTIFLSVLDLK